MSGHILRADAERFKRELVAHLEVEVPRRMAAHAAELKEIIDRDGYRGFCSRWYDLVAEVFDELEAEAHARLRALEVAGSA